jgi:hypothetical protein
MKVEIDGEEIQAEYLEFSPEFDLFNKNWVGWDKVTYERTNLKECLESLFPFKSKFEK